MRKVSEEGGTVPTNGVDPGAADQLDVVLGRGAGSHSAKINPAGELVVTWYHHGEDADYEFAKELVFDENGMVALRGAPAGDDADLLRMLAGRFRSYWQVRDHADAHGIPYTMRTDWWP